MVFKKIGNWWKKMEDRYGHMDKKDAFMMGKADGISFNLNAHMERKRLKEEKKKAKKMKRRRK
jgi:hypothetical protein